ncbi:MAG: peptidylprolyl isomerase [Anaerolineales bacterium]|jgi:FKBP-type peptidyl-prolyl cis-trans isomerase SlyD|nr:peptidylprolyl isomerase [Anaerolineales bacterium]
MADKMQQMVVTDDLVVTMAYTLTVEGEIVDSSEESEPIQFIQGAGHILPALEEEIYGMAVGDEKEVVLSAEEGYGEIDLDAFADIPRSDFPAQIPLKPGVELQLKDQDGEVHYARIESIEGDSVRLNMNHPLAGKELNFYVQIEALRTATEEELEHGHVHLGHEH